MTPQVVAEALELDNHRQDDDRTMKEWIKEYTTEADIKVMREALCWPREAKWVSKKSEFQTALSYTGLKYPNQLWQGC